MDRDKQIEEKRELKDILYWSGYGFDMGTCNDIAKQIQEQGYRKTSEFAREIFEGIEEAIDSCVVTEHFKGSYFELNKFMLGLAELKKKYTEGEG